MLTIDASQVDHHYSAQGDLASRLFEALRQAGKDPEAPRLEDLAGVDEFHVRGRDATLELGRLAELRPGQRVLDVGGGLGGPARTLASEFGCDVEVLDLTAEFCRVGELLTRRMGMADQVRFRHGDALAMPYEDAGFDVLWSQHSSMNIADKARLYGEMARVLRPGGRLALYEIMAGPVSPLHFPVPWARSAEISSLEDPAVVKGLIESQGLENRVWRDGTEEALAWMSARMAPGGPPLPLGVHVILGPDVGPMMVNAVRNMEEGRIRVMQGVFDRPTAD